MHREFIINTASGFNFLVFLTWKLMFESLRPLLHYFGQITHTHTHTLTTPNILVLIQSHSNIYICQQKWLQMTSHPAHHQLPLTLLPCNLRWHHGPFTSWPSMKWLLLGSKLCSVVFCWASLLAGQFGYWHKSGKGRCSGRGLLSRCPLFLDRERDGWARD